MAEWHIFGWVFVGMLCSLGALEYIRWRKL